MKILIVGKYPPIQGGVSSRTYHTAHGIARLGHEVHVVTNATEVVAPYRMFMRDEDWDACEADYGGGSVRLHWTAPVDRLQYYIPMASPFVTKLASLGIAVCREYGIEVVFSYYMEPYGVAGHLIAQTTGLPHVVRTAGSDAGRLWDHPHFKPLYDEIFCAADLCVAGGPVARKLLAAGVDEANIQPDRSFEVPRDLFSSDGPALDVAAICAAAQKDPDFRDLVWGTYQRDIPYFGVYGKLGSKKGTDGLLTAIARLRDNGLDAGLLMMGHGRPRSPVDSDRAIRRRIEELGLTDLVQQLPFLPHWRVPEFIRRCLAVCCLEQDFPITFHGPIIAREVLACGGCLVGSTEILQKLPASGRIIDGYNCVAVHDVNDIDELTKKLADILRDPDPVRYMGIRGQTYVDWVQLGSKFPARLEYLLGQLLEAADEPEAPAALFERPFGKELNFPLTLAALALLDDNERTEIESFLNAPTDQPDWGHELLSALNDRRDRAANGVAFVFDAVRLELGIAAANSAATSRTMKNNAQDQLFRLKAARWALTENDIANMVARVPDSVCVDEFDHDANAMMSVREAGTIAEPIPTARSAVAYKIGDEQSSVSLYVLDAQTAALMDLCDGKATVAEISAELGGDADANMARLLAMFESSMLELWHPES